MKFYMCVVEGASRSPVVRHPNYAEAATEAERLAREYKKKVYVLESFSSVELTLPPVLWILL